MFGISGGELFFIAIIALIVLGPERLPKVTRFAGLWVRRARAQWYSVKDELERELAAEELKRSLHDAQDAMRDTEQKIRDSGAEARREFDELRNAVANRHTDETPAAPAEAEAPPVSPAPSTSGDRSDEPRNA
jgi:sec-independent protein translocase protein TatB